MAARIAIIAITTSSSIRVNPERLLEAEARGAKASLGMNQNLPDFKKVALHRIGDKSGRQ
jgi:hypothetical protein